MPNLSCFSGHLALAQVAFVAPLRKTEDEGWQFGFYNFCLAKRKITGNLLIKMNFLVIFSETWHFY